VTAGDTVVSDHGRGRRTDALSARDEVIAPACRKRYVARRQACLHDGLARYLADLQATAWISATPPLMRARARQRVLDAYASGGSSRQRVTGIDRRLR
jgi:hypothetical protein